MSKRGYHHGNLKQALVDAALRLIEEKGPTGFTLSEAAKNAGVTPAAVYRHFEGREDLIAECARQGHEIFADLMEFAFNDGKPSALAASRRRAAPISPSRASTPATTWRCSKAARRPMRRRSWRLAAAKSRTVLENAAEALSEHIPPEKRPPPTMFSAHIWAMSHGVVELFARGRPGANTPFPPEDLLEAGIGIYLRGLGLIRPDD
jgi:AcrR family transcriptional regulator